MFKAVENLVGSMVEGLIWIFTAKCNLSCRHCYVQPRFSKIPELELNEKLRVIEEAGELGIDYIGFSGGEPLVHPHFPLLLERCHDLGMVNSIVTNGIALSYERARMLARYDVYVNVSVDGPDARTHELLRGPGTWSRLMKGIGALREAGVDFSMVMAVCRYNYLRSGDYVELAERLGAVRVSLIPVMRSGMAANSDLLVDSREYAEAVRQAVARAEELGMRLSLWCTPFAPLLTNSPYVGYWSCRQSSIADLDPGGRILLCDVLDFVVARVGRGGLREALIEYETHPLIRKVSEPQALPRPCRSCPVANLCMGGCFARAFLERGTLEAADPLCPRAACYTNEVENHIDD